MNRVEKPCRDCKYGQWILGGKSSPVIRCTSKDQPVKFKALNETCFWFEEHRR